MNNDGKNDITLDGSSANISYSFSNLELLNTMRATVEYNAPEWVPDGADVTFTVDVLYNSTVVDTMTFTGTLKNGEATMTAGSSNFWQYIGWDDLNNFSFRVSDEEFTAVKVLYFDDELNNITNSMTVPGTDKSVAVGGSQSVDLKLSNTCNPADVVDFYWTNAGGQPITGKTYKELDDGQTATGMTVADSAPVTVYMDLSDMVNLYKANNSSIALKNFDEADDAQVAADKELKISFTAPTTGLKTGAAVDFTVEFTSNTFDLGDIRAYRVVIEKLGVDTIISVGNDEFNNADTGYEPAKIGTEDLTITAADVKLYAIEPLEVTGVSIDGNKATITFNRDVTVEGTDEDTVSVTGEAAGQVAAVDEGDAGTHTVIVTLNLGKVFGENDIITIKNDGTSYIKDVYGDQIANGTVAK